MWLRQIIYDAGHGIYHNRNRYLPVIVFFLTFNFICYYQINLMRQLGYITQRTGFFEYLMYYTEGMRVYIPSETPFRIPFAWLSVYILNAWVIGDYVQSDLYGFGMQMLVRYQKRIRWAIGKLGYILISVLTVWGMVFLSCGLFNIITAKGHFSLSKEIWAMFYGIHAEQFSNLEIVLGVFVLPILTSAVLSVFQIFLSLMTKPSYGFLATTVYLIFSAYWKSYFLIGNYAMFLRNAKLCENGIEQNTALIVLSILLVVGASLFFVLFRRYDILERTGVSS